VKRILIAMLALVSLAGCATGNFGFVYKPGVPAAAGPKLPAKLAVLAFRDGTEEFATRGSIFALDSYTVNLVKGGIPGTASALTPELWGKAFADDLTASGGFQSVRFVYGPSELVDEDFRVEGTVEKAYAAGSPEKPYEIAIGFRALRRTDNRLVWEKEVTRVWTPRIVYGCGLGVKCVQDQRYSDLNQVMQGIFAEAGTDLKNTLSSLSGSRAGGDGLPVVAPPASQVPESSEGEITRILEGK
jgi:hypothetical protein